MSVRLTSDSYRKVCVVIAVAMFFTNFANYAERWGVIPLYWIGILGAMTAPLLAIAALTERLPIRPMLIWAAGYGLAAILWYFPSAQDDNAYQALQTAILSVIFLLLVLFLCARPAEQRLARIAAALAAIVSVGLNLYELFNPMTFSKIPGRSSGLFENANQSGAALMLGMILGYGVIPAKLRAPFVLLIGAGIVTTFTRSAMLGWMLIVVVFVVRGGLSVKRLRTAIVFALLVIGFILSPAWSDLQATLQERGALDLDLVQRLQFFSGGGATDDSASDRMGVLRAGWAMYGEKPFLGHGTGAAREIPGWTISTHNTYLANMIDFGILGLFLLPSLLLAIMWGANRTTLDVTAPFIAFLAMWGMFTHNLLEERYILFAAALVASMAASARGRRVESTAADLSIAGKGALAPV